MNQVIDTHCHLYTPEFQTDIHDVIERAKKEGVHSFYLPAIDSSTLKPMLDLESAYPGKCHAMIGLHPCSVKEDYEKELQIVEDLLKERDFAGIGETGLDYYWDLTFKEQQIDAFDRQIGWSKEYGLPIIIHSRNSTDDCISLIEKSQNGRLKGIFHCFSGSAEQASRIIGLGFYVGIGGVLTYKNAGLAEVIKDVSPDYIVLETDAPYLSPVPFRGKRNESSYLKYIVQKLAEITRISEEELARVTTQNARKVFGVK